jgi:YqaJ-like viral recombinase domain
VKVYSHETHPQGGTEWFEVRRGIPTASQFSRIITPKTRKLSAQVTGYMAELIGDIVNLGPPYLTEQGRPPNAAMQYGAATEPEARRFFELERGVQVKQVGFITTEDGKYGFSPDFLIGEDGYGELKCPLPKTHAEYLLEGGGLPSEYLCQCHGGLALSLIDKTMPFTYCCFESYCPGLQPLLVDVKIDDFTKALADALVEFDKKFQAAKAKLLVKPLEPSPLTTEENAQLSAWDAWLRKSPSLEAFNAGLPDLAHMRGEAKKSAWKMCVEYATACRWERSLQDPKIFLQAP